MALFAVPLYRIKAAETLYLIWKMHSKMPKFLTPEENKAKLSPSQTVTEMISLSITVRTRLLFKQTGQLSGGRAALAPISSPPKDLSL